MLNDLTSPLSLLQTRRSGRPRDMVEPGPSEAQLREIVRIASRTPDHGKLAPWRFVHVPKARRDAFARLLQVAYSKNNPEPTRLELEAIHRLAHQAPALIVVLSSPVEGTKIPLWEQELSCGAACMNLLSGAHALGFVAGWITGWATYAEDVRLAFARSGERLAGFIFIGTPANPLEERTRPALYDVFSDWAGNGDA